MSVGARIKWARENIGMCQMELSRKLDIPESRLAGWEAEPTPIIPYPTLLEMCSVLKVSPHWIHAGNGSLPKRVADTEPPETQMDRIERKLNLLLELLTKDK